MRTPRLNRLLALLGLTSLAWVQAAGTPAGTVISNQASATAVSSDPNEPPIEVVSNTISTTVSAVCAVSVTPDGTPTQPGQRASILPGEQTVFSYTVLNAGNQATTFALSSATDASSGFTPAVKIYLDTNGNGQLDTGEPLADSVTLDPDQSARFLLAVQTAGADHGSAFVSLNAGCGNGGASDTNNYAAVNLGQPPALSLSKSFSPAQVKPGEGSTVTLTVTNSGQGASREVIVTDPLNTPALTGASFVAGSDSADAGVVEYSADGSTYSAAQPATVAAIRLRVPSLAAGARATLTFKLATSAAAENKTLQNLATVTSSGTPGGQAGAGLTVRYTPGVALGPVGNPTAAEGSPADSQNKDFAVVGQTVCFTQTIQNTGDVADDFTVAGALTAGQADLSLRTVDGAPLAQPVHLEPGQSLSFQACLKLNGSDPVQLVLTATGARGETNRTTDTISRIETQLPQLQKTVNPTGQVTAGQSLTYTLTVSNPYSVPLTGVVIRDPLSSDLSFVSASDGGSLQDGAVVWTLGTLAPGETRRLTLQASVAQDAKDGDRIQNTFTLGGDQFPTPTPSPTVESPVWSAALAVSKSVSPLDATVGDRLDYTVRIRNLSQVGTLNPMTVTDTLPAGVAYIPGSAQLNGQPLADPQVAGRVLTWTLGALGPQTEAVLTYAVRVTPEAVGQLVNVVSVRGEGLNGAVVASNEARASLKLRPGMFSSLADLIGLVFVDRNRDGVYQAGFDTPVERARVVLADGRIVLTDREGRYHFAAVPEGFTALRLDPASVPYAPLSMPQDGGRPGSRGVFARGLTSVDFPLAALMGQASAFRETTLHMGTLTLRKQLALADDGSYTVTLTLSGVSAPLHLDDPLPDGATLLSAQNVLDLPGVGAEPTTLTYRFRFDGAPERAVTDPTVTWRNP